MKEYKIHKYFGSRGIGEGELTQIYDLDSGTIKFYGEISVNRKSKDGKRMFYYSIFDHAPILSYFLQKCTYRKQGAEKEEADSFIKSKFEIDMND